MMAIPTAVVINRCDIGDNQLRDFCREQAIPILTEIPEDMAIASAYSEGVIASSQMPQYHDLFEGLLAQLLGHAGIHARRQLVSDKATKGATP